MNLHTHFANLIRDHATADPAALAFTSDALALHDSTPRDPDGFTTAVAALVDAANEYHWWTTGIRPSPAHVLATFPPARLVGDYTGGGLQAEAQVLVTITTAGDELGSDAALCSVCGAGITSRPGGTWRGCEPELLRDEHPRIAEHEARPEPGTVARADVWDVDDARSGRYRPTAVRSEAPLAEGDDVERWRRLARHITGPQLGGDTVARLNLRWAQRLVHGLPLTAADREVNAVRASITGDTVERRLTRAYLAAYDRLAAGALPAEIKADTARISGNPAWRIPTDVPHRPRRVDQLNPGDIIRGRYADGPCSYLDIEFCGPLVSRSQPINPDQPGTPQGLILTLADDLTGGFDSNTWFAVYPVAP